MPLTAAEHEVTGWSEAIEAYFERGWTDGLPVVPATAEAVSRFLEAAGRKPDDVVLRESTRRRTITAEKIAINAVMAGCRPEYMPVLLAALTTSDLGWPTPDTPVLASGHAAGRPRSGR